MHKNVRGKLKRMTSLSLALLLTVSLVVPYLTTLQVKAATAGDTVTLTTAHGEIGGGKKIYCIDKGGLAVWGTAAAGDKYQYHRPSEAEVPLSERELDYVFWGILTLQASRGDDRSNQILGAINANAAAQGKATIRTLVTEEDLKALIYMSSVRGKYPWLETVASNTEDYLTMGGLLGGGGGTTQSGKKAPDVIASNTLPTSAFQVDKTDFTIQFDSAGADADFLQKVPVQFSNDNGVYFGATPTDGWTYTKTSNSITFSNPNPMPPKALVKFATEGTEYASTGDSYASKEDLFDECLQLWENTTCSGTHYGGSPPFIDPWLHQRMVTLEFKTVPVAYYAALAGDPGTLPDQTEIIFNIFRHEEDFSSNYNVQLYKYDYETGKPLEKAQFILYERFDDKDKINTKRDGPAHIYKGGAPYASYHKDNPVIWDGFRQIGTVNTDSNGRVKKTVEHGYHYDKTFCDGHPAPVFMSVPEPEIEEEDPANPGSGGGVLNQPDIDNAKAQNSAVANAWLSCVSACEDQASGEFDGVHFHWVMSDVDEGKISDIASSGGTEGDTPEAGNTSEPDPDTAYEESGCSDDLQETYDKFISLKYSYAFTEFKARDGYIRHDVHPEDVPVEIITTDSSENGANAYFAGEYSKKDALSKSTFAYFGTEKTLRADRQAAAAEQYKEPEKPLVPDFLTQDTKTILHELLEYGLPEETEETTEEETEETEEETEEVTEEEIEEGSAADENTEAEESSEAGESTKPDETNRPEETTESAEVTEPAETTKPEESTRPTKPDRPEETSKPTESSKPAETAKPEESTKPTEPGKPEETSKPTESSKPAESDKPAETTKPKETEAKKAPAVSLSSHTLPLLRAVNKKKIPGKASPSEIASPSEVVFQWLDNGFSFRNPQAADDNDRNTRSEGSELFDNAYDEALSAGSSGDDADTGPDDNYSHCNNADRDGDTWRVYDHRTEGEFHINKKDMDLAAGENDNYSAYGDAQGDGTLEGAVYGLFAASDITHPDGKTGVVYRSNNLVAVAATDKNGDASFLANTEAPGYFYAYTQGAVVKTADGWADNAPENLYMSNQSIDDYTEDGDYVRTYQDNQSNNGNCWIGRPLIMGDYYIKELSRSEGYELSVGNKLNALTNKDQDLDAQTPEAGLGYAVISHQFFADEQISEDGKGAGPNELFFSASSKDTDNQKYDITLNGLPDKATVYRKDVGTKQIQVSVGTGTYQKVLLTNPGGSPKYIVAENDYQYPKYNADGSLMTKTVPINHVANAFLQVPVNPLDTTKVQDILNRAETGMTAVENQQMLAKPFAVSNLPFVKGKAEAALRRNGKGSPRTRIPGGGYDYSSVYVGVFDGGVRKGDTDPFGLSGVTPGSPAAYTVYGSPVQKIAIPKLKPDSTSITIGDAILSVLDYYNTNSYYSYGGIDAVEEVGNNFVFTIYASVSGAPANFMVLGSDPKNDSIIYHSVNYIPQDASKPPRLIYASYSNNASYNAFGTYENYKESTSGSSVVGTAALVTDAVADGSGNLQSKTVKENVYYLTGEQIRDEHGNLIQAFEYQEITITETKEVEDVKWQALPVTRQPDGTYILPVNAAYTDAFGVFHTNAGAENTIEFKAVLEEKRITLTAADVAILGPGYTVGHQMGSAGYYVHVKNARAKAYLDYLNSNLVGDNTYICLKQLVYESQEKIVQDAGTREKPVQAVERAIRQKVKIIKDLQTTPEGTYDHNTNADAGHQDGFTTGPGGTTDAATKLPNFRFKIYLKSNLERLYRDETGSVTWLDRDGKTVAVDTYRENYPETDPFGSVQKLYTKVPHKLDSQTTGSLNNNTWDSAVTANSILYSYQPDGQIRETQNSGYTRLLETVTRKMEDGAGKTRQVEQYNYEKFFDAVKTANHDKWDRQENDSTSAKPFAFIRQLAGGKLHNEINTSATAKDNALRSDAVRQFAITWYLDDEVKKLQKQNGAGESHPAGGSETYQEEVYDKALAMAISKTENYLKPFFAYDLDEFYSIAWDSEADGGKDKNKTTLSADTLYDITGNGAETSKDGYYYGISKYLPYGAYVAVEQQPFDKELGDFYNKHYKTDLPKEIILPSVYEADGNIGAPEVFNKTYEYKSADTPEDLQKKYHIRFNEEWAENHTDDLRKYVIRAHNKDGDFEIYKYGLDPDKLTGTITYPGSTYQYTGFTITQEEFDPYKDIYGTENTGSDYGSNQTIEAYYRYGSLSENSGTANDVLFQHGAAKDDNNPSGMYFKDNVKTMTGALTAYDELYAASLVPWTVTEPVDAGIYDAALFNGYADGKYRNTFYTTKLRIEKLDSETGENILHDGAVFALYSADREDTETSDGLVSFYTQNTVITSTREFLEAMGAEDITPVVKSESAVEVPYLGKYYGTIKAGTPICREEEQIVMKDAFGKKTGAFKVFTTTRDGELLNENGVGKTFADQNVGYLITPQPLGAGGYVLAEIKAPEGYAKSKPVAIEIYSDEVAYYMDGNKDDRVVAAVYEEQVTKTDDNGHEILNPDGTKPNGNKLQDKGDVARVYLNNTPIRLEISKIKTEEGNVKYKVSGRVEGSITELSGKYGADTLEFAYNASGKFLNYAWRKGTLENLENRKKAGENVEIIYQTGVFAGYGFVTKPAMTADDPNQFVSGALLTLHDAIKIRQNGDSQDFAYDGLVVERNRDGNVTDMYVQKGYAGNAIKYVMEGSEEDTKGPASSGKGTWTVKRMEREDTRILYYDLGGLKVTETGADGKLYGYDRNGKKVLTQNRSSIFAMKDNLAYLELSGGDFSSLTYDAHAKAFTQIDKNTKLYHLDTEGIRDAMVDSYTGMAYVPFEGGAPVEEVFVWPVNVSKSDAGAVIAREKIKTGRPATINADTENEYVTGTWNSRTGKFEKRLNPILDRYGFPVYYQLSPETYKKGSPIYDRDGDYVRYRYDDNLPKYNDVAYQINTAAGMYEIGAEQNEADDKKLYHRQGEALIIENTWLSGERYPNDPTRDEVHMPGNDPHANHADGGQADLLKRVYPGNYILEELKAPEGYSKGMPFAVAVPETDVKIEKKMVDETVKVDISKIDGSNSYLFDTIDKKTGQKTGTMAEDKSHYSFEFVKGATLALFTAERLYTSDWETYPNGYYLKKTSNTPYKQWVTENREYYIEGIPAGDYILEELAAPSMGGYLISSMEIVIEPIGDVQNFILYDDHTKVEILKYYLDENGNQVTMPNLYAAELSLYEAITDADGNIVMNNGIPEYDSNKKVETWKTDDLSDYLSNTGKSRSGLFSLLGIKAAGTTGGFKEEFEKMYGQYGDQFDYFSWQVGRYAERASKNDSIWICKDGKIIQSGETFTFPAGMSATEQDAFQAAYTSSPDSLRVHWSVSLSASRITNDKSGSSAHQIWEASDGKQTRVSIYQNAGRNGYETVYEYQFGYRKIGGNYKNAVSYTMPDGRHRIDYLPFNAVANGKAVGNYVLVETATPDNFETAKPKPIVVDKTGAIQRYSMENKAKSLIVVKTGESLLLGNASGKVIKGATLSLYREDAAGGFTQDDSLLVETWVSGTDGVFTEEDLTSNQIPAGFKVGDLRPHVIKRIAYGTYYLAETIAPPGYTIGPVQKIVVTGNSDSQVVYKNYVTQGILTIYKHNADDKNIPLAGAVFKIINKTTKEEWIKTTNDLGQITMNPTDIGSIGEDGEITLYEFTIEEIVPPEYHQINPGIHTFKFTPDGTATVYYKYELANKETEILIGKTDFDNGMFIKGAKLAIYKAVEQDGEYVPAEAEIESWISDGAKHLVKGKLSAGKIYLLMELYAPPGYTLSKPLMFTLSADGRRIVLMTDSLQVISFTTDGTDAVSKVDIIGRVANKVEASLTDIHTGKVITWTGTGTEKILTKENGIEDGHIYTYTETIHYSDGNTFTGDSKTFRMHLNEDGSYRVMDHTYGDNVLSLSDTKGNLIEEWTVESGENGYLHTIINPVKEDIQGLSIESGAGANGSAVMASDVVKWQIKYRNGGNKTADINIKAVLADNVTFMRATHNGYENAGGDILWILEAVKPGETGVVEFVAKVESGKSIVHMEAVIGQERYSYDSPLAKSGTLSIINKLAGSDPPSDKTYQYEIRLLDKNGKPLSGIYDYEGSRTGSVRFNDTITLSGDEYVTINGLPWDASYKVTQNDNEGVVTTAYKEKGTTGKTAVSAVFLNKRNDKSLRDLFVKGESYVLSEETALNDRSVLKTRKLQFALDENCNVTDITMLDKPTKVVLSKTDITGTSELPGATLNLLDENRILIESWVSTGKPHEITAKLEAGKTYYLVEVSPPNGYGISEEIKFSVNLDGRIDIVRMEDKPTDVEISKRDITNGEELPGAHMQLMTEDGIIVEEWISGTEPHVITAKLIAGKTYVLKETLPPDGYAFSENVTFVVSLDGRIDKVEMIDKPTKVELSKQDITNGEELPGAHMQLTTEDGIIVEEWISGTEPHVITAKLIAGKTYILKETLPPDGYAFSESVTFVVSLDGRIDKVEMKDKPTKVEISKRDITSGEELPGAHMQITTEDGTIVEEWISGDTPHMITGKLIAGKTYILSEVLPPDGYATAESIKFIVSTDGQIDKVTMEDKHTKLTVTKENSGGSVLPGAVLQITDMDGKVLDEWTTTTEPHIITGFVKGVKYRLIEIKAPPGYLIASPIEFVMGNENVLVMVDLKPSNPGGHDVYVKIRKLSEKEKPLMGAEFAVFRENGSMIASGITGEDGYYKFLQPSAGTYYYIETKAPAGYYPTAQKFYFVINDKGDVSGQLVVHNTHEIDVVIQKKEVGTLQSVPGATLLITDDKEKPVFEGVTSSNGTLKFTVPGPGRYFVREIAPPEGYRLNPTVYEFTVSEDGKVDGTTIIYDYPDKPTIPGDKIGKITASYERPGLGEGTFKDGFGTTGTIRTGFKTGDNKPIMLYLAMIVCGFGGLGVFAVKRRAGGRKNKTKAGEGS